MVRVKASVGHAIDFAAEVIGVNLDALTRGYSHHSLDGLFGRPPLRVPIAVGRDIPRAEAKDDGHDQGFPSVLVASSPAIAWARELSCVDEALAYPVS